MKFKRSWRYEDTMLQEPVTAGLIFSAVVGAASSYEQSRIQQDIAEEQKREQERIAEEERLRQEQILRDTRPDEQSASTVQFGGQDPLSNGVEEFIVPKNTTTTQAGLSGLGFQL